MSPKGRVRAVRIGVVVGEDGSAKQALLSQFVARRREEGLAVAGVVEIPAARSARARDALLPATMRRAALIS